MEALKEYEINQKIISIPEILLVTTEWPSIFVGLNLYHNLIRCALNNPDHIIGEGKIKANTDTKNAYCDFNDFVNASLRNPSNLGCTNLNWNMREILSVIKLRFRNARFSYLRMLLEDATSQMETVIEIILSRNRS